MKITRRILCFILMACLLTVLLTAVSAAGEDPIQLSMDCSESGVSPGDRVLLTIRADRAFTSRGCGMTLRYDSSVLTPELDASSAAAPFTISHAQPDMLRISFLPMEDAAAFSADQELAVIAFRVSGADIHTEVDMSAAYFYDSDLREISVTRPAPAEITVESAPVIVPDEGYTVTIASEQTTAVGEMIQIPVVVGNTNGLPVFNAFDIRFSYDLSALELTSTEIEGMTVTYGNGKLAVFGYGQDRAIDTAPFTLTFRALKPVQSVISIASAHVDNSGNAALTNASKAEILEGATLINVLGYPVTLPEGFEGALIAEPNAPYIFAEPEDLYDYTVHATVGGEPVEVVDQGDGSYMIPAELVNGIIEIAAERTGKRFPVTLGTDMQGDDEARYMEDYTAALHRERGYDYQLSVTIGGEAYTGYTVSGDVYTIPGPDITGDIIFAVFRTESFTPPSPVVYHKVTFEGSGAGAAEGNAATVSHGSTYRFTLKTESGYTYAVSYTMGGGASCKLESNAEGVYTIGNVTGDLLITITKTQKEGAWSVAVSEYLTLDRKAMFLVLVTGDPGSGRVYTYNGEAMYYSEGYKAWCVLTVEEGTLTASAAKETIGVQAGTPNTIRAAGRDVDMNARTDLNDARLVWDMYNVRYGDFSQVNMRSFLNADVNGDKKITASDAAAVVFAARS